jgi:hypothetical protein
MPWAAAATVVAAGVSYSASQSASKRAASVAETDLEFAQAQYQDWQDTFGSIQDNLADYYTNLTPEQVEAQDLEAFELEKKAVLDTIEQEFAQRGITTSGLHAGVIQDIEMDSALQRAQIRTNAPTKTRQAQQNFLQIGLGQNPANNLQNVLSNRASTSANEAAQAGAATAAAVSQATSSTFDILQDKFGGEDTTSTTTE